MSSGVTIQIRNHELGETKIFKVTEEEMHENVNLPALRALDREI